MSGGISLLRNKSFVSASTSNAALSYLDCRAESTSDAVNKDMGVRGCKSTREDAVLAAFWPVPGAASIQ